MGDGVESYNSQRVRELKLGVVVEELQVVEVEVVVEELMKVEAVVEMEVVVVRFELMLVVPRHRAF